MLNVRLRPEAKKPPNGAMSDAKVDMTKIWNCMGDVVIVVGRCVQFGGMNGNAYVRAMNTGLTSHSSPVKMLAPRSLTGQMKYFDLIRRLVRPKPKMIVQIQAPTKPAHISFHHTIEILTLTFDSLLWAEFDKLCSPKRDTANVCKDVVCDDKTRWQEEPNHALKDVVHDEMCLHNDQVQGHVSPGELRKLESIVALLQGANKEDKTCKISTDWN